MVKKGKKKPQKGNNQANDLESSPKQYQEGDLVAAQVKGWPHWPARITSILANGKQLKYAVKFFETDEKANLLAAAIVPFEDYHPKASSFKRKGFQDAFAQCTEELDQQRANNDQHVTSTTPLIETTHTEEESSQSVAQSVISETSTLPKISAQPDINGASAGPPEPSDNGSTSSMTADSSCKPDTSNRSEKDAKRDNKIERDKKEKQAPVKVKSEKASPSKVKRNIVRRSPTKLDTRTDDSNTVLPKVETEDPNSRDFTIKKLQSKIDAKLKEKARMKQEQIERKRVLKSTDKLVRINRKLVKFLKVSRQLNQMISLGIEYPKEWDSAVEEFQLIHAALVKCIVYLSEKERSNDLKACRDILTELAKIFKKVKGSDKIPKSTQDKIKSCIKLTRKNSHIKQLINMDDSEFQKQENAMIERKENSAEH